MENKVCATESETKVLGDISSRFIEQSKSCQRNFGVFIAFHRAAKKLTTKFRDFSSRFIEQPKKLTTKYLHFLQPRPERTTTPTASPAGQPAKPSATTRPTEEEVREVIRSLKNSGATGPDGIPTALLKRADDRLLELVTRLANLSLTSGHYPTQGLE